MNAREPQNDEQMNSDRRSEEQISRHLLRPSSLLDHLFFILRFLRLLPPLSFDVGCSDVGCSMFCRKSRPGRHGKRLSRTGLAPMRSAGPMENVPCTAQWLVAVGRCSPFATASRLHTSCHWRANARRTSWNDVAWRSDCPTHRRLAHAVRSALPVRSANGERWPLRTAQVACRTLARCSPGFVRPPFAARMS